MSADVEAGQAVVLLSGGMDSSTLLAWVRQRGFACYALSFDYGQRHHHELRAAEHQARALGAREHRYFRLDLAQFGGSVLTDPQQRVPEATIGGGIPPTYVPARNTVFLAIALAWAEARGFGHLFIGANAVDYSGYPDCRPEFIHSFEQTARLATRAGVQGEPIQLHAPFIAMSKAEIIRTGIDLGVDYAVTVSCYQPDAQGRACARCDACRLRRKGFAEAQLPDPATPA